MFTKVNPACPFSRRGPCETCHGWTMLDGEHPLTGEKIHSSHCFAHWLPVLLCEVGSRANQTAAAVESAREHTIKALGSVAQVIVKAAEGARPLPRHTDQRKLENDT